MYKTQYKTRSPYEPWNTLGNFTNETTAIAGAMRKKLGGALVVRVTDKDGAIVYVS